jgi:uncharacterized protein with ACT and thioredoxin-like domain
LAEISAGSILPAHREDLELFTADGLRLVGELATPIDRAPAATIICLHPLTTHGGMMDSHVLRKMAWRLPALAGIAVLRFNMRGAVSDFSDALTGGGFKISNPNAHSSCGCGKSFSA